MKHKCYIDGCKEEVTVKVTSFDDCIIGGRGTTYLCDKHMLDYVIQWTINGCNSKHYYDYENL